jgi:hypothetical protein
MRLQELNPTRKSNGEIVFSIRVSADKVQPNLCNLLLYIELQGVILFQ